MVNSFVENPLSFYPHGFLKKNISEARLTMINASSEGLKSIFYGSCNLFSGL